MRIPATARSGDTVRWRDAPFRGTLRESISAETHALSYIIRGQAGQGATVQGVPAGQEWTFVFVPQLVPGTYYWQAVAVEIGGTEQTTAGAGSLEILPNLAFSGTPGEYDGRSQARKDLEACQAAIRSLVSGGAVAEYTIGNRRLKKMELSDLLALESKLKADVVREEAAMMIANGMGDPRKLHVRFRR
jgi:hypothetical protein